MLSTFDPRLAELRLLENLADGTWSNGVCASQASGQSAAIGISQHLYADMLVTLIEDGWLSPESNELWKRVRSYLELDRGTAQRRVIVTWLETESI